MLYVRVLSLPRTSTVRQYRSLYSHLSPSKPGGRLKKGEEVGAGTCWQGCCTGATGETSRTLG